ncbi:MAG: GNAT family N-acetyltransferase [Alphaproteobacteria bacterium]|nr:GNAT family N-acetyltransferase [Alphaproteobacteria bacterium]
MGIELVTTRLSQTDLDDLCDATDAAIKAGGGFGWVELPSRDILERYWQGVVAMPLRMLFVARLDGVVCGTCQVLKPPANNEAQKHAVQLTGLFISPWARGRGISRMMLDFVEDSILKGGYSVINLDVRETMSAAIQLYESSGYQLVGKNPYYAQIHGAYVEGRYYTKKLGTS